MILKIRNYKNCTIQNIFPKEHKVAVPETAMGWVGVGHIIIKIMIAKKQRY